ncbi:MAG: hypothetical protein LC800_20990 [Acidobacteria bacterium]|nr:hypothetical protein [Acidobacteriota bacterium]
MKRNFIAAALCALCLCAQMSAAAAAAAAQDKPKAQPATAATPQAPAEELKAAQAVEAATDAALALAAAAEFVKKYPKSTLRMDVARVAADKVFATTDAALRVTHGEGYLKIFTAPEEANLINPRLVRDYVAATRLDDAYRVGALAAVEKFDDPLGTMIFLSLIGENEVRKGNGKYLQQSQQLAARAAELIETDKRPASLDEATWGPRHRSVRAGHRADGRQRRL